MSLRERFVEWWTTEGPGAPLHSDLYENPRDTRPSLAEIADHADVAQVVLQAREIGEWREVDRTDMRVFSPYTVARAISRSLGRPREVRKG